MLIYKGVKYKPGSKVVVKIDDIRIEGKLQQESEFYFICHNEPEKSGRYADNRLGYDYSWAFKQQYDGSLSDNVVILGINDVENLKENFEISEKLISFFQSKRIDILSIEDKRMFPGYNKFDISETKGMIKLLNSEKNRSTDLKFGRFLNSFYKQFVDIFKIESSYDNKKIEKTHNDYVSYQTGNHIKVEYLLGKQILDGYKRDNYQASKSSLGGSCMTDKLSYLDLYTKNPNKVSMVAIKMFDKFVGRCLLWTTNCGKKVMDKPYICDEWVLSKFDEIREKEGYLSFNDVVNLEMKLFIDLDTTDIDEWPYLDTFMYLTFHQKKVIVEQPVEVLSLNIFNRKVGVLADDYSKGILQSYAPKGYSMRLRGTSGRYDDNNS
jgi:hypothetical protein